MRCKVWTISYVRTWKHSAAISAIWRSEGVFVDPDGKHLGLKAIDDAIERLLQKFPDFVFSELSAPDSHNGIGRMTWGFGLAQRTPTVTGLDVIVSMGGKIKALYTFLDRAPR
jgi:hypothetical protein